MAAAPLLNLVAAELDQPVDRRVTAMAEALARQYGSAARSVLFYGSCLRQSELDGLMLDFYLIVSDYRQAYQKRWMAIANRLIPPNVFPFTHEGLAAKYAVLSEADFARSCSIDADHTSVWARFAQPARLVWAKDEQAAKATVEAISQAAPTLFALTRPAMAEAKDDPLAVFRTGFALTYGAELRAERAHRSDSIVESDPGRYRQFGEAVLALGVSSGSDRSAAMRQWRARQRKGKALTVIRLIKASTTFAGGADYLVWKINRHAGTEIRLKPWQRRWPLLAALTLLPRLLKRGAIR
ncbi:MAG: hypothetical protein ACXW2T_07110 [Allosphingosinicella sp.]